MRIYLYKLETLEEMGPVVDKTQHQGQTQESSPVSQIFGNLLWKPSLGSSLIWLMGFG